MSGNFLERIVERKREEVARLRREKSFLFRSLSLIPRFSFFSALTTGSPPRIIAEVKRASPSKGALNLGLDPVEQARLYQTGGASVVSVLTDAHFHGTLEDLESVAVAVDLPVLRKDFILDPVQLMESQAAGASAVLLIVAILGLEELRELVKESQELGLEPLVEVHSREELEVALATPARIIGINSRNLRTFQVDLGVVEVLAPLVPKDRVVVAESGISTNEDVRRLMAVGVENFLIGEALVRAGNPEAKLKELSHQGRGNEEGECYG